MHLQKQFANLRPPKSASLLRVGDWYNYDGAHYYGKAVEIAEELGYEPKTVREAG